MLEVLLRANGCTTSDRKLPKKISCAAGDRQATDIAGEDQRVGDRVRGKGPCWCLSDPCDASSGPLPLPSRSIGPSTPKRYRDLMISIEYEIQSFEVEIRLRPARWYLYELGDQTIEFHLYHAYAIQISWLMHRSRRNFW